MYNARVWAHVSVSVTCQQYLRLSEKGPVHFVWSHCYGYCRCTSGRCPEAAARADTVGRCQRVQKLPHHRRLRNRMAPGLHMVYMLNLEGGLCCSCLILVLDYAKRHHAWFVLLAREKLACVTLMYVVSLLSLSLTAISYGLPLPFCRPLFFLPATTVVPSTRQVLQLLNFLTLWPGH